MIAKVAFFCAALAAVSASGLIAPLVNTGVSARSQTQDVLGNYAFGYNIKDGLGATCLTPRRCKVGWLWKSKRGSYTITDIGKRPDELLMLADGHGFKPPSSTNEARTTGQAAPAGRPIVPPSPDLLSLSRQRAHRCLRCCSEAALRAPSSLGGVVGPWAALVLGVGAGYGATISLGGPQPRL
ncbi:adult-specific rigid cuticular protein 15.5 [Nephila pilipes]|uniref:Adult-specific rigid cuticular protein 15.5 n=1 Tax=Nephila pilipes TaxID=299642 RepID=A0A8X6NVJ3_NEPPI|nr:adult-specific rigid cuticular protein 15.5 [Nephila pilipes]